jgi:hypothetical protein
MLTNTQHCLLHYTGCFIMYSCTTKIYDGKAGGHVFTKPLLIEGTTRKFFPRKFFVHRSSHFCRWVSVQAEIKWSPINR